MVEQGKNQIGIVNVESAELAEGVLQFKVTAKIQLPLKELQEKLRGAGPVTGIDPVDLESTPVLAELLKKHLDLAPFEVVDVEAYAVTQYDAMLGITLKVAHSKEIKALDELMVSYENQLRNKLQEQLEPTA